MTMATGSIVKDLDVVGTTLAIYRPTVETVFRTRLRTLNTPDGSKSRGLARLVWPSRVGEMASPFFERLRANLRLQLFFDVHLAQSGVLRLKLLHAGNQRRVHATVLRSPLVERRHADA